MLALLSLLPILNAHGADVRDVLEGLSRRHGFALQGLENVAVQEVNDAFTEGDLQTRLQQLLQRYNYVVVSGDARRIERVVIIGAKSAAPTAAPDNAVRIRRDGLHHRVEALLTGPNGQPVATNLIIDTGASNIVLPASMIERLGFRPQELAQGTSQTASGTVRVRVATLGVVTVGGNEARDVAVSFVEDGKLGDLRLLGMSFLHRFRVTIDDQKQRLILIDR